MLSAAHVLAMDAKNLLDVVDSVRVRHPELFHIEDSDSSPATVLQSVQSADSANIIQNEDQIKITGDVSSTFPSFEASINTSDNWIEQQSYENLNKMVDIPPSSFQNEIYVNQEQIKSTKKDIEGINDNNSIQQQNFSANTTDKFNIDAKNQSSSSKPPIAAKSGR